MQKWQLRDGVSQGVKLTYLETIENFNIEENEELAESPERITLKDITGRVMNLSGVFQDSEPNYLRN
jgi:hypothetical protein